MSIGARRCGLFLLALLLGSCATSSTPLPSAERSVTMFVGVQGTLQAGVAVFAVMSDGTRKRLGITDISGSVTIDPAALSAAGAVCLLFEKEGYFTGAIWLPGHRFADPSLIELAQFAIP